MPVYQIDYDLRKQRDYQVLYERIKKYGNWCRPLHSTWIIHTHDSALKVHQYLTATLDENDVLLVTQLEGDMASSNIDPQTASRLKRLLDAQFA